MPKTQPIISIVIATHNRCAVVMDTLDRIAACGLPREAYEIIVVDNASTDGTREAIGDTLGDAPHRVIALKRNLGSCAKAIGVDRAAGSFIVFLDDDSFPRPGSLARMLDHFDRDPQLAAAGFTVHLPDGRREGGALPGVFVGCGVGFRTEVLRAVGGLDRTFFMQAEEYDLSFRLVASGWRIAVFDDLAVDHQKTPQARIGERTLYHDTRNNLRVIARYLPDPYRRIYRDDWTQRYAWFAQRSGHERAFRKGRRAGTWRALWERRAYKAWRLSAPHLEFFFRWGCVKDHMNALVRSGVRRVVFADLGKNVYAFYRAARSLGVEVSAIGDDRFAARDGGSTPRDGRITARNRSYRGIPVLTAVGAVSGEPEAIVVANTSSVHAQRTAQRWRGLCEVPLHAWFAESEGHKQGVQDATARHPNQATPHAAQLVGHP